MEEQVCLLLGWCRENVAFLSDWGKESTRSIIKGSPREVSNGASYNHCYYPGNIILCLVFKCIISFNSRNISEILLFILILQMRNLKLRGIPRCHLRGKIP